MFPPDRKPSWYWRAMAHVPESEREDVAQEAWAGYLEDGNGARALYRYTKRANRHRIRNVALARTDAVSDSRETSWEETRKSKSRRVSSMIRETDAR